MNRTVTNCMYLFLGAFNDMTLLIIGFTLSLFMAPRRTIKNSYYACFATEMSASRAEDRTNSDFLIEPTCYFCWALRHTCRCTHTNTHNLRNVSRRFECQGFPSCWPAVRAAAGLGCVALCKETLRTTWQSFLLLRNKLFVFIMCSNQTHDVIHLTFLRNYLQRASKK